MNPAFSQPSTPTWDDTDGSGICVSAEVFQKRLHQALEGLQGVVCIADDIIIHGKDTETHDQNLNAFLQPPICSLMIEAY